MKVDQKHIDEYKERMSFLYGGKPVDMGAEDAAGFSLFMIEQELKKINNTLDKITSDSCLRIDGAINQ